MRGFVDASRTNPNLRTDQRLARYRLVHNGQPIIQSVRLWLFGKEMLNGAIEVGRSGHMPQEVLDKSFEEWLCT
jgi:hypothetical protein